MTHQGYGFVEFASEEDADYAIKIMNMIKMYGKPIRVNKVNQFCAVNFVPAIYPPLNMFYNQCISNCIPFSTSYCYTLQAASNTKNLDVGANAFIGNLDPEIDEKLLYDTFSAFGVILQTPKVCSKITNRLLVFIIIPVLDHERSRNRELQGICFH